MSEALKHVRKDYQKGKLEWEQLPSSPDELFQQWLAEAKTEDPTDYNCMTISTIDANGYPQGRIVLLRGFENGRLKFYTNYNSDKGQELAATPKISVNFFWKELERQVRVTGDVQQLSAEESDAYFQSRPRSSRIGAWASDQSSPLETRDQLEDRVEALTKKFSDGEVPRPPHWGGYGITPVKWEFWQGRASRLHDRFVYSRSEDSWETSRIQP